MALSWRNPPYALKAAIGCGKQTLGRPASLPRHRGRGKALGLGPGDHPRLGAPFFYSGQWDLPGSWRPTILKGFMLMNGNRTR